MSQTAHPSSLQLVQIEVWASANVPGGQNCPQIVLNPSLASCKNKFGVQAVHFSIDSQALHWSGHFLQMFSVWSGKKLIGQVVPH